jgi:hypothetical protein
MMKKLILALSLLLFPSLAWAQCTGVFPSGTVCGNDTGSAATPRAITGIPGSGTVTNFTFTNSGGFTGVVTGATSTPNLTLSVTQSGDSEQFANYSGALTNGNCVSIDSGGNFVDAGGPCTTGGGGGTVAAGTQNQLSYYAATGATVSGLTGANDSLLKTNASGVPSWSTVLPPLLTNPITTSASVGVLQWTGAYPAAVVPFMHTYTPAAALSADQAGGRINGYNTFLGYYAGNFTMGTAAVEGGRNVGIGYRALMANTTGWQNTAVGFIAQQKTTSGIYNTVVGTYALSENTTGSDNVAIGADALWKSTTAGANTVVGTYAMQNSTTASNSVAVGKDVLRYASTTASNVGVGYLALSGGNDSGTPYTGTANTALGANVLKGMVTGVNNVALGMNAMSNSDATSYNVAIGHSAGQNIGAAGLNVVIGYQSTFNATSATAVTAVGPQSLSAVTTGSYNTGIGYQAGNNITTGTHNTIIGDQTGFGITTGVNNTVIGSRVSGLTAALVNNIILADGAGAQRARYNDGWKLATTGTAPVLSSCGTTPAISGDDFSGTVTMGTSTPTGCIITFTNAKTAAPHCIVSWRANIASMAYTTSTTALTITQTATDSNLIDYICTGL